MKSEESKGKKANSQKLTANKQEHKKPWQETCATPKEIKLHREQPDLGTDGSGEVW